jgi:hypothetical protein
MLDLALARVAVYFFDFLDFLTLSFGEDSLNLNSATFLWERLVSNLANL